LGDLYQNLRGRRTNVIFLCVFSLFCWFFENCAPLRSVRFESFWLGSQTSRRRRSHLLFFFYYFERKRNSPFSCLPFCFVLCPSRFRIGTVLSSLAVSCASVCVLHPATNRSISRTLSFPHRIVIPRQSNKLVRRKLSSRLIHTRYTTERAPPLRPFL
jgi:hypothetical protein